MARQSFMQIAQACIARELYEGNEAQFFKGLEVISADPGDIAEQANRALAEVGLCVVVEVPGGPAPIPEDPTEWDAQVTVAEVPSVHRSGNFNGKTADVVVDAILRRFPSDGSGGGHFRAVKVTPAHETDRDGKTTTVCYVVEGKTLVILRAAGETPQGEC